MRKPLKTVRSHVGYGQWLDECPAVGFIPRQTDLPSPYASGPVDAVFEWKGHKVFFRETAHKVYRMFEVPAHETITNSDDAADLFIARLRAAKEK